MTEHTPSILDLKLYWINFALYCTVLYFLLRNKVATGWRERQARLAAEVAAHRKELETVEAELRQLQNQLASAPEVAAALKAEIARDAGRESAQIVTDAKKKAEKIAAHVAASLATEKKAGEAAVRKEIAQIVIERALTTLRGSLNAESDRPLREASLGSIRELMN